ncbi:Hypothetical predicted protein [Olea europaea subsp. europaea]|uniref:Uncharacterized protein n=1 Tax=Olea europaea subsp. europaea TaxID=158383 RepID=A0A8S0PV66_OLEEU|nr:Hypothetical predicted protein [Olea europaea subsp. europaea]
MDANSGKRAAGRVISPRKRSSVNLKDRTSDRDQNAQFCNRIGCSGRIKYSQNSKIGILDKAKCAKPSMENGKEITRNTSTTFSMMTSSKKSYIDLKSSRVEFDSSESSVSSKSEIGSSSVSSNIRSRKVFHCKSGSCNQNTLPTSSVLSVPNSSGLRACNSGNGSRCSLRNLKCNSTSDVVPRSCSSSESQSSRKDVVKKRSSEGGSSSSSGWKKTNRAVSFNGRVLRSTNGISISDSRRGSWTPREDASDAASVRTQRLINGSTRTRLSSQHIGNVSRFPQPERPIEVEDHGSSSGQSSYSLSSSSGDNLSSLMPSSYMGLDTTSLVHDALQRRDMDGIAEILLALERIGQDEPLTREQVLAFETSLIISGLNLYDQHRDMRLDIDNMSYEVLLSYSRMMV